MKDFSQVTREEYLVFIKTYPGKLEFDCTAVCEPPLETTRRDCDDIRYHSMFSNATSFLSYHNYRG